MPLLDEFIRALATYFSVPPEEINVRADGVTIAGVDMPVPGTFDLLALLNGAVVHVSSDFEVSISSGAKEMVVWRAELRPQEECGIIELSSRNCWVFLGTFGTAIAGISLDVCPELILAIACFSPISLAAGRRDWSSILESWGPLIASTDAPPEQELAEFGCFKAGRMSTLPEFCAASECRPFIARAEAVQEALNAYVFALQARDGPDVVFLRFYRIFELQFAATIQSEISGAPLARVYETLRALHSASEFDVLSRTFKKSNVAFNRFTVGDFEALFGQGFRPTREHYSQIGKWLDSGANIPPNCRAPLVYFVRCALVHSKITESEKFLFGPFEPARAAALDRLSSEIRDVLRDLLAL